jgi:anti-anti-sigma factor
MASFEVETNERDEGLLVRVRGDAGVASGSEMQIAFTKLIARRDKLIVLDLSDMSFIASLGMGVFVEYHKGINRHGGTIRVAGVQPMVREAFQRCRLDELFECFDTVDDAFAKPVA